LTKNERNKVYLKKNSARGRGLADSKWRTKKVLMKAGVSVPGLIGVFKKGEDVENFDWLCLEGNFVVKPISGYGGEGVIVVRRRGKWAGEWRKMDGELISLTDLKMHCRAILSGKYSLHGMKDGVIVEERIKIHPKFLSLTRAGTPDVRVIVYNRVPVMAMLRVPTEESGGKSNLQQGAIGLGLDMATGITTYGLSGKSEIITKIFDHRKKKNIKVNGVRIPDWREILKTAVECQKAIPELGFMGVDVVLDKDKGPVVLEVNARPGLSIQLCNKAGLKSRLRRVEGIKIKDTDHGVDLAKYLFAEDFWTKVEEKKKDGVVVVNPLETVKIKIGPEMIKKTKNKKNRTEEVRAKIDTGAFRSSIDERLADDLGLLVDENVIYYRHYRSALGKSKGRPVINLTFWLKGKRINTAVSVANRAKLRTKFLIGRKDLKGVLVSAVDIKEEVSKKIKKVKNKKL
jgi:alpha-L-glutamate ligase-like protein